MNRKDEPRIEQVVSTHGNDHLTVVVALFLEEAFGGWRPPRKLGDWES